MKIKSFYSKATILILGFLFSQGTYAKGSNFIQRIVYSQMGEQQDTATITNEVYGIVVYEIFNYERNIYQIKNFPLLRDEIPDLPLEANVKYLAGMESPPAPFLEALNTAFPGLGSSRWNPAEGSFWLISKFHPQDLLREGLLEVIDSMRICQLASNTLNFGGYTPQGRTSQGRSNLFGHVFSSSIRSAQQRTGNSLLDRTLRGVGAGGASFWSSSCPAGALLSETLMGSAGGDTESCGERNFGGEATSSTLKGIYEKRMAMVSQSNYVDIHMLGPNGKKDSTIARFSREGVEAINPRTGEGTLTTKEQGLGLLERLTEAGQITDENKREIEALGNKEMTAAMKEGEKERAARQNQEKGSKEGKNHVGGESATKQEKEDTSNGKNEKGAVREEPRGSQKTVDHLDDNREDMTDCIDGAGGACATSGEPLPFQETIGFQDLSGIQDSRKQPRGEEGSWQLGSHTVPNPTRATLGGRPGGDCMYDVDQCAGSGGFTIDRCGRMGRNETHPGTNIEQLQNIENRPGSRTPVCYGDNCGSGPKAPSFPIGGGVPGDRGPSPSPPPKPY